MPSRELRGEDSPAILVLWREPSSLTRASGPCCQATTGADLLSRLEALTVRPRLVPGPLMSHSFALRSTRCDFRESAAAAKTFHWPFDAPSPCATQGPLFFGLSASFHTVVELASAGPFRSWLPKAGRLNSKRASSAAGRGGGADLRATCAAMANLAARREGAGAFSLRAFLFATRAPLAAGWGVHIGGAAVKPAMLAAPLQPRSSLPGGAEGGSPTLLVRRTGSPFGARGFVCVCVGGNLSPALEGLAVT